MDNLNISNKYRLEKGFLGAHSDIGGGYKSGDLSNVALMWMIKQAKEKGGINLKDYTPLSTLAIKKTWA